MSASRRFAALLVTGGALLLAPDVLAAQQDSRASAETEAQDGSHDFDFHMGTWRTHLKRLAHPLSGSDEWLEYGGTTVVRPVLDGKANLVELLVDGPDGHFEGLSLRLYDPRARQWSLNFSNPTTGTLSPPSIGEFRGGRGEFYSQETFNGRTILVRFVITPITPDSIHFEQSYSDDGGKTWELNWDATDTRIEESTSER